MQGGYGDEYPEFTILFMTSCQGYPIVCTGYIKVVRTGWPPVTERNTEKVESRFRRGKGITEKLQFKLY